MSTESTPPGPTRSRPSQRPTGTFLGETICGLFLIIASTFSTRASTGFTIAALVRLARHWPGTGALARHWPGAGTGPTFATPALALARRWHWLGAGTGPALALARRWPGRPPPQFAHNPFGALRAAGVKRNGWLSLGGPAAAPHGRRCTSSASAAATRCRASRACGSSRRRRRSTRPSWRRSPTRLGRRTGAEWAVTVRRCARRADGGVIVEGYY